MLLAGIMVRALLILLLAFLAASTATLGADKQGAADAAKWGRRSALVIGNGTYKSAPLTNPPHDARLMADALKAAQFKVIKLENASREAMLKAISDFGDEIEKGGVGVFYYAGHGVQVRGENYLLPVDVTITREEEIRTRGVNAQEVLDRMASARNGLNLVFLDACRNDPFPRSSRGAAQGLAKMDAALGMLISYATAPGSVAEDGSAGNSPYTRYLASTIKTPGLRIEDVLKRVRSSVRQDTDGRQITWDNSSIEGEFYFVPGDGTAPACGRYRHQRRGGVLEQHQEFAESAGVRSLSQALPERRLRRTGQGQARRPGHGRRAPPARQTGQGPAGGKAGRPRCGAGSTRRHRRPERQ